MNLRGVSRPRTAQAAGEGGRDTQVDSSECKWGTGLLVLVIAPAHPPGLDWGAVILGEDRLTPGWSASES